MSIEVHPVTFIRLTKAFRTSLVALLVTIPCGAFALEMGADMSWVTQIEWTGFQYRNDRGQVADPFFLLKQKGGTCVRLRVWVNPQQRWNNLQDTLNKASRAKKHGLKVMLNFHYSDSWADPGKQTKPAAWQNLSFPDLTRALWNHTTTTLAAFKQRGIKVDYIQIGNETNSGMLWPDGSYTNFDQLAVLYKNAYSACKSQSPGTPVMIHLANGHKINDFRWMFDNLQIRGVKWDIIGLSSYPGSTPYATQNQAVMTTMVDMISRYGSKVCVAEIGLNWNDSNAKPMLVDMLKKVKSLGSYGVGVFYWEPAAPPGWQGYHMGQLDATGRFTNALDAFRDPLNLPAIASPRDPNSL